MNNCQVNIDVTPNEFSIPTANKQLFASMLAISTLYGDGVSVMFSVSYFATN